MNNMEYPDDIERVAFKSADGYLVDLESYHCEKAFLGYLGGRIDHLFKDVLKDLPAREEAALIHVSVGIGDSGQLVLESVGQDPVVGIDNG